MNIPYLHHVGPAMGQQADRCVEDWNYYQQVHPILHNTHMHLTPLLISKYNIYKLYTI